MTELELTEPKVISIIAFWTLTSFILGMVTGMSIINIVRLWL